MKELTYQEMIELLCFKRDLQLRNAVWHSARPNIPNENDCPKVPKIVYLKDVIQQ